MHYAYDNFNLDEVHRQVASLCHWLFALNQDTDLEIQVPVADPTGALCQFIDHRPDGPAAVCTVQRWVKGKDIAKEDAPIDLPKETMHELGTILGRIHKHGRMWSRPDGFNRMRINWIGDVEEVERDQWKARENNNASGGDLATLRRTIEAITRNREARGEPWGLTHGDFTPRNCVQDEGHCKPIDFDLCALTQGELLRPAPCFA